MPQAWPCQTHPLTFSLLSDLTSEVCWPDSNCSSQAIGPLGGNLGLSVCTGVVLFVRGGALALGLLPWHAQN
jgi:hypothetical protein